MRPPASLLLASLTLAVSWQQTPPVFRGGVDLVTADVAVVDKEGKPITGLTAKDFAVIADKRPRRVVSAEYVAASRSRAQAAPFGDPAAAFPMPTTNGGPLPGRTFLFVVDVEQIDRGSGRLAMRSLADYLDRLSPDDRVGIISLPTGVPHVDLTTNRKVIADAMTRIVGASIRNQDMMMTVGEAAAIEQMDQNVVTEWLERIDPNLTCTSDMPFLPGISAPDPSQSCAQRFIPAATSIMDTERHRTRTLFANLQQLAESMAPIDGPKGIVLVSQGLVNDRETLDAMQLFGKTAEKARVSLYAINLQETLAASSGRYDLMSAHVRDHHVLLDGMATLAIAGRGDVFVVSGTPADALARIDAEMAGYYLLSFERDAGDRDGQRARIEVQVSWPDATVRWRREFTPGKAPAVTTAGKMPADLKGTIGFMLRWPVPVAEMGIDLDTYASPTPGGAEMRTILAAALASGGKPIAAAGYEVSDGDGRTIAAGFEPVDGTSVSTQGLAGDRRLYTTALALPPGAYRLKMAAIDSTGRRGSLEHMFEVRAARAGTIRMSDVFIGELSEGRFLPSPVLLPGTPALPARVEICGDLPTSLAGATVTLELGRPGAAPFARAPLSLTETTDRRRRLASATIGIGTLPAGQYLLSAILLSPDGAELRTSRVFTKR